MLTVTATSTADPPIADSSSVSAMRTVTVNNVAPVASLVNPPPGGFGEIEFTFQALDSSGDVAKGLT
jgi:hypothetical protein